MKWQRGEEEEEEEEEEREEKEEGERGGGALISWRGGTQVCRGITPILVYQNTTNKKDHISTCNQDAIGKK